MRRDFYVTLYIEACYYNFVVLVSNCPPGLELSIGLRCLLCTQEEYMEVHLTHKLENERKQCMPFVEISKLQKKKSTFLALEK